MVGVAKSHGCLTCLKRKIKCDEGKPTCKKCQVSRRTCEGYPSRLKFINEADRLSNAPRTRAKRTSSGSVVVPVTDQSSDAVVELTGSPSSMSLIGFRESMQTTFLVETFFDGIYADTNRYSNRSWITQAVMEPDSDVANMAVKSLAATFFARRIGQDTATQEHAGKLYSSAIMKLAQNLSDPQKCLSHSNVLATLALNYYELWTLSGTNGWISHAGGIGSLVQRLGPEYFREYPAHGTLLLTRTLILYRAAALRVPTFLAEQRWRTIPWELHPETYTESVRLQDIITEVPSIMSESSVLENLAYSAEEIPLARIGRFQDSVIRVSKALIAWRMEWEINNPNCASLEEFNHDTSSRFAEALAPLAGRAIRFDSYIHAKEITLYNTILGYLLYLGREAFVPSIVHLFFEDWPPELRPAVANELYLPDADIKAHHCIGEIFAGIKYQLTSPYAMSACFDLMQPIRTCMNYFLIHGGHSHALAWMNSILEYMAQFSGMAILARLSHLSPISTAPRLPGRSQIPFTKPLPATYRMVSEPKLGVEPRPKILDYSWHRAGSAESSTAWSGNS